jgi:hypothetical protein
MTVAVAFKPRSKVGLPSRRGAPFDHAASRETGPPNRRYATVILRTGNHRGLKATATIAKSLRDECG